MSPSLSPSMASNCSFRLLLIILIHFFLVKLAAGGTVPEQELNSMLTVLRGRGYNLFANAITTSDIYYDIISGGSNFTFFAPVDSALFALDMTAAAVDYVTTLRLHVVPRRLTFSDLRTLASVSSVSTLMPGHEIVIERRRSSAPLVITVDGVEISVPGLFYGRDIAVHGLEGILSFRSRQGMAASVNLPSNFTGNHSVRSPAIANFSTKSHRSPVLNHGQAPPPANFPGISSKTFVLPPGTSPASVSSPDIAPSVHGTASSHLPSTASSHLPGTASSPPIYEHSGSSKAMLSLLTSQGTYKPERIVAPPETFNQVDEEAVDCTLTKQETDMDPVSHLYGHLYTREHYTVSSMACAKT